MIFKPAFVAAKKEFLDILRTKKAKVALSLFLVWATVPGFLFAFSRVEMDDVARKAHFLSLVNSFGLQVAQHLWTCPLGEQLACLSLVGLLPLITFALVFDRDESTSTTGSHSTPLELTVHLVGKRSGAWGLFCIAAASVYLPIAIVEVVRDQYPPQVAVGWCALLWGSSCMVAAAYFSCWRFLATCFQSRRAVLIAAAVVGLLMFLLRPLLQAKGMFIGELFPGSLHALLLADDHRQVLVGTLITVSWCFASGLASSLMLRFRESGKGRAAVQIS